MIEIHLGLFVGSQDDCENLLNRKNWYILSAAKEPYHRAALGYTGRAAPKGHPEYLMARRGNHLALNLVDVADPAYIPENVINAGLAFIDEGLWAGQRVLVHCNQGGSRSPVIGLLYLASRTDTFRSMDLQDAEEAFLALYPGYNPAAGMRGFAMANWEKYSGEHEKGRR